MWNLSIFEWDSQCLVCWNSLTRKLVKQATLTRSVAEVQPIGPLCEAGIHGPRSPSEHRL